jgi:zinc transporter 9
LLILAPFTNTFTKRLSFVATFYQPQKMYEFLKLIALSSLMGIGSFLAGYVPLWMALSPANLDTMAIYGAGMLIGAVFLVIIPEGVESIYSSTTSNGKPFNQNNYSSDLFEIAGLESSTHFDKLIGISLLSGFVFMLIADKFFNGGNLHNHSIPISVEELREHEYGFQHSPTPTLGLVVHAAADGVAMGSVFVTGYL